MARQLCFFGIALLVVLAYGIEVLSLGWLIVLLILLFLLWFPLRGQVELHIEDEINAVVSLLPLPFWRLPVLRMTRPYHWWRTLGEDLERLEQKKNSSQQTKPVAEDVNPAASHVRQPQAGATAETTPETREKTEPSTKPQTEPKTEPEGSASISAQLVAKALGQVAIQKFQLHITLGGSPMVAALAGGSCHMVIGWAATVLRCHAQRFAEPDITICLDPGAPWIQGHGALRLKTDLAGIFLIGVVFWKERRRKRNGRKSD